MLKTYLLAAAFLLSLGSFSSAQHSIAIQGNGKLAVLDSAGDVEWEMEWPNIHDICAAQRQHHGPTRFGRLTNTTNGVTQYPTRRCLELKAT